MANKNIKNSAREARAKKMELLKEKNYEETMKKLKLKREEDAERNKAISAKLEVIIISCFFFSKNQAIEVKFGGRKKTTL